MGPGAAWAWHWAHKGIHKQLDRVLRHGALPVDPLGPLGYEAAWVAACDLTQVSQLVTESIKLDAVDEILKQVPAATYDRGPVISRRGALASICAWLARSGGESSSAGARTSWRPRFHLVTCAPAAVRLAKFYSD